MTGSIDGTVEVRTEQTYNNMSKATYEFNKALFNPLHKSYYNETDIQILTECRTIPPVGELNRFYKVFNQKPRNTTNTDLHPKQQPK